MEIIGSLISKSILDHWPQASSHTIIHPDLIYYDVHLDDGCPARVYDFRQEQLSSEDDYEEDWNNWKKPHHY